mgnify:FL=1
MQAGWRVIVQWGGIQGTPGTSGGVVHGANLTAAAQMVPGTGNDYDVSGISTMRFVKPHASWVIGGPICFNCTGNPPIDHNASPVPSGFVPFVLDSSLNYTPAGASPTLWYFRYNGIALQQISRTNF